MTTTIQLSADEYNTFLRCVLNLKEECNDIDIQNGVIRQRSNDKTSIFQLDLTSILTDVTITFSDIKRKYELLKIFSGQDVRFDIDGEEGGFITISDDFSSIEFKTPSYQFIDNKFMTEEELDAIFNLETNDLILEHELTNMITERIKSITQNFNIKAIQVIFNEDTATIKAGTQAKDQLAEFVSGITTNIILENCSANLGVIPFNIESDNNTEFKMYKVTDNEVTLNTFKTSIEDCEVSIFTRSQLIRDDE